MDELLKSILKYGLIPTALLVFLFMIIQDPTRAYRIKSLILLPFFKLFKWFKREYVANEVSGSINAFFYRQFKDSTDKNHRYIVKIKWVRTEDDPILKQDNIIIRMRRDEDQTKNI